MTRVLIIGGSGLVGRALASAWERRGAAVAATHLSRPFGRSLRLDMRELPEVRRVLSEIRPDWVALPGSNPFVDECELKPDQTRSVNVEGPRNAARACAEAGAPLLFFSSDYVFDGRKGSDYEETDAPAPLNEYGRQKLAAESVVLGASDRNLIVRTSGVYGWQDQPKNFVLQVVSRLRQGQLVRAADDVSYCPTNADSLAENCALLAARAAAGLFHLAGAERLSRFEFARRAAQAFGLDPARVEPAKAADFRQPAARPALSALSCAKARAAGCELWGVERGLAEMRGAEAAWRRRCPEDQVRPDDRR